MTEIKLSNFKTFFYNRKILGLTVGLVLFLVIYSFFVASNLETSDVQVVVRYTAFGDVHFYRDKWFYLINFILFGIIITVLHVLVSLKLYVNKNYDFAIAFLIANYIILTIAFVTVSSVLRIAFL